MFICLSLDRMTRVGHSARVQKAGKRAPEAVIPALPHLYAGITGNGFVPLGVTELQLYKIVYCHQNASG